MTLEFFKFAANLKKIQRQGWVSKISINNPESVADHTFSMAIIGMVISDLENYDTQKIIKMILLHDLAESKVGDFMPEQIGKQEKKEKEDKAFEDIIDFLPQSIKLQYRRIWKELQEKNTPESSLVHQIDKLEMALQAKIYQKDGYSQENLKIFFNSAKQEITHPKLKELFTKIIEDN